jgi:hypothetical protein
MVTIYKHMYVTYLSEESEESEDGSSWGTNLAFEGTEFCG